MARCETCGAELDDPRQRFCGGDRCARVLLNDAGWRERTPPVGSIGYTGSYREPCADVVEVSVVSVLEARGPD
jgi:hypothetical protein